VRQQSEIQALAEAYRWNWNRAKYATSIADMQKLCANEDRIRSSWYIRGTNTNR